MLLWPHLLCCGCVKQSSAMPSTDHHKSLVNHHPWSRENWFEIYKGRLQKFKFWKITTKFHHLSQKLISSILLWNQAHTRTCSLDMCSSFVIRSLILAFSQFGVDWLCFTAFFISHGTYQRQQKLIGWPISINSRDFWVILLPTPPSFVYRQSGAAASEVSGTNGQSLTHLAELAL